MKKLPAYIMVIALLVMNITNVAHADCVENTMCGNIQAMVSVGDVSEHDDGKQQNAACDCCTTCCGHHHNHVAFVDKAEHLMTSSQMLHSQEGENYFSQLHYPPSKPPKA